MHLQPLPSQASKPEAPDPLRLSFFSILGFFFRATTYLSCGTALACIYFLFKAPRLVDDIPLLPEKGFVYVLKDTRPLTQDWIEKRKKIFSEEGVRLEVSDLDLNSWAAKAFPPGPLQVLPKEIQEPFKTLQSFVAIKRSSSPRFFIKPEGVYWSQGLSLNIGQHLKLPIFAQMRLIPQREQGSIAFKPESLTLGWLKVPLDGWGNFSFCGLGLACLYPANKELANLKFLLQHLLDVRLDNRQLLLFRKGSASAHKA